MTDLTNRQAQVLGFLASFTLANGYPPTLREICAALDIKSTNGANDHLMALERKGMVRRPRDPISRGTVLTDQGRAFLEQSAEQSVERGLANNPEPAPKEPAEPTEPAVPAIKTRGWVA